jgi:dephospho-CoA kinase
MCYNLSSKKIVIGIIGKIGTGKSTLINILKSKGYKVILMDKIGHLILEEQSSKIKEEFLIPNESSLRSELRNKVFSSKEKLKKLNSILHPLMKKRLKKILENEKKHKIIFVEAAVLFEMGIDEYMNKIVYLDARNDVIVSRVARRSGLSKKEIMNIIKTQKEYVDVKNKVDVYIDTSDKTKEKVYEILIKKLQLEVGDAC